MSRYWAVFVAGLVWCVLSGPGRAEEPAQTQLWLRAAVPPQPHGESPGVLLKRGDAVTPVGKIECEIGEVTTVRFGPDNQHEARIPTWLLSTTKPPPLPDAHGAAGKSQGDLQRLKGAWGVVARSVLGTLNPAPKDKLNERASIEYWHRREVRERGSGDERIIIRGGDAVDAGAMQMLFPFDGCNFTDKETAFWQTGASDCSRPLDMSQGYVGTYEFRIDAITTPKQLDFVPRINATRDVLAIYEFDGEFLKIAIAPTQVLMHSTVWPRDPTKDPWRRPAGFDAESAKYMVVSWLSRLDEREFPAPPSSLTGMPTLLRAPGVETSERLSEPLKKLLGTWREVVHEQDGSRDYAGLTWNFAPGRVTAWYPELPDRPESYGVYSKPGFIVDPTKDPPRLDLLRYEPMTKSTWIVPGIYAWEGDRLKWCLSGFSVPIEGQSLATIDRLYPKKFETAAEGPIEGQVLVILERSQQPVEVPTRQSAFGGAQAMRSQEYRAAVNAQTKAIESERSLDQQERQLKFVGDSDRLRGTWRVVSEESESHKIEEPDAWEWKRSGVPPAEYWNFSPERVVSWSAEAPGFGGPDDGKPANDDKADKGGLFGSGPSSAYSPGKFAIDDQAQPKHLDLIEGDGDNRFVRPGIYRWNDLRLEWSLDSGPATDDLADEENWNEQPAEKRRPTDFKTAATGPAAHRRVLVLRRVMEPIKVPEVKELK